MNKTETEREENWLCVECDINYKNPNKYKVYQVSENGWCDCCSKRCTLVDADIVPKGQKAVTFYIPEGMTFGEVLMESWVISNRDRTMGHYQMYINTGNSSDKQIQEAIDKLNQEKDGDN